MSTITFGPDAADYLVDVLKMPCKNAVAVTMRPQHGEAFGAVCSSRPAPSMLAVREHARRAVLRCTDDSDGRRYGASFCSWSETQDADSDAFGDTHSTGCRARF
jgi:hypothetical protein